MPSNQTLANHSGDGKTRAADIATAALGTALGSPAASQARDVDENQDDVAVDDLLVQGVRMADLKPENLIQGSPAWNAAAAYRLITHMPHAAGHFESVAREWATLANAHTPAAAASDNRERGRDQ